MRHISPINKYITNLIDAITFITDFPVTRIKSLDIVDAGLEVLGNNVVSSDTIESARFTNNRITYVEADAFR